MTRKFVFLLIFFFGVPIQLVCAELKLTTLEWAPYVYNHSDQGYVAQLVKMAFANSNYEVKLSFFPWARALRVASNGTFAGYFPEYYSEQRSEEFYFSESFPAAPLVLFKRKKDVIEYSNLRDLEPYTIAVVTGYVNTEEFDKATYLKKEKTTSDLQNFKMLMAGRVDLVVADKYVGYYLVKNYLPESLQFIDVIDPPLDRKKLYLCVSKKHPDAVMILQAFNNGLYNMRNNGFLENLTQRFFSQNDIH
ncbi:substrate-binding periplasmic protein [Desulfogranum marinum]|uniref:substrate-binding periplasmic protein n=1 Tax=Desulfogranum marinum TaxID=453220 RepID=UPI001962C237|nr:transporter substrate-binding domain-containing protein [Desulfogranum marinum]MBM9512810.1 transporter substrate-binding domain-containing protein [Desulfogranum marinum]